MRSLRLLSAAVATVAAADTSHPSIAEIWFVNPDGTGEVPTIQAALDVAVAGDVIELGPGTFTGPDNRKLGVHETVTIRAREGATCVLDCEDASRAFSLYAPATLERLTIRNGLSVPFPDDPWYYGGGMAVLADAQITGCVIETCRGDDSAIWGQGGGAYVFTSASPTFTDCAFTGNTFVFGSGDGGGLYAEYDAQVTLVRCTFERNEAVHGGGLAAYDSDVTLEDCVFAGNLGVVGGGIHAGTYGWPSSVPGTLVVQGSRLTGNARGTVSGARGAGIHVGPGVSAEVISSTIAHNRGWYGGALEVLGTATVTSSILWGNCAIGVGEGEAAWVDVDGRIELSCSIVDPSELAGPGQVTFHADNVAADPLFCASEPCEAAPTATGVYDVDAVSPALALPGCGAIGAVAAACAAVGAPIASSPAGAVRLSVGPSPFTAATEIRWAAPASGRFALSILDVSGRRVRSLAGSGHVTWDGTDDAGRPLASGVYFVRLDSAGGSAVRRVVLRR